MIEKITNKMAEVFTSLDDKLKNASTTNWKVFSALLCGVITVIMYWVATMFEHPVEQVSFGMLLTFIITWIFDGRKHFEIKRKTTWKPEGAGSSIEDLGEVDSRRAATDDGTEPV